MIPDTSILGKTSINSCKFPMSLLPNSASFNCLLALLLSSPPWKKGKKNSDEKQWQIHWIYCVIRWCKFIALFDGDFHIKCVRVSRCNREKKIKGGLISEIIINFVPISNKCTKSMIVNYLNVMGKVDGLWFRAFFWRCTLNMRFSHL